MSGNLFNETVSEVQKKHSAQNRDYIMCAKIINCTQILLTLLSHLACCPFELSLEQKQVK